MLRALFSRSLGLKPLPLLRPVTAQNAYFCSEAEEGSGEEESGEEDNVVKKVKTPGSPTLRRKKRQQVTTYVFKKHFVKRFLRQFVHTRQKLYPVATVVHLYERRVKWHKRHKEWEENQTFKLLRRKERETRHRDVERKFKNWKDAKDTTALQKWQAEKDLRTHANVQALEILKKTEHLWEFYPDEMQDLKYDIRRSHRPYYTRYN